jgi:hypothetical protein
MRVPGIRTNEQAMGMSCSMMGISITVSIKWANLMAREFTTGPMARYTTVNSLRGSRRGMVFGQGLMEKKITLANGLIVKLKVMVSTCGQTGTSMKVNGRRIKDTAVVVTFLATETHTLDNMPRENHMALDSTNGLMSQLTRVTLLRVLKVVQVNGNGRQLPMHGALVAINTKEVMRWTKNVALAFFSGSPEMCILETIFKTNAMVLEK